MGEEIPGEALHSPLGQFIRKEEACHTNTRRETRRNSRLAPPLLPCSAPPLLRFFGSVLKILRALTAKVGAGRGGRGCGRTFSLFGLCHSQGQRRLRLLHQRGSSYPYTLPKYYPLWFRALSHILSSKYLETQLFSQCIP